MIILVNVMFLTMTITQVIITIKQHITDKNKLFLRKVTKEEISSAIRTSNHMPCTKKMKSSIKDFFSKCDQICSFLRIWSYLRKKSLMENFIFCAVMSGRAIWDKLPKCIFENFEVALVKRGVFLDELKLAKVVPIYKKNDKNDKDNYKPISILSNLSKTYEICIQTQLNEYFAIFFLAKYQCGFLQGFKTQHCLLVMIEKLRDFCYPRH